MSQPDAATSLRKVSALRALCLRLPHLPTPAEQKQLRRFEILAASPHVATQADIEAIVTGWARWWRSGTRDSIRRMAAGLPNDFIDRDRRPASYLLAATFSAALAPPHHG